MIKKNQEHGPCSGMSVGGFRANAEFRNFKLNLGEEGLLTADEIAGKQSVSFGVVVNADGSLTRVDASDTSANLFFQAITTANTAAPEAL